MKSSAGLAACPLLIATLLLSGCYEVPVTGRSAVNLVDERELTKQSIAAFDDMKRQHRPSTDKERIAQLQRVGERISKVVFWDMPDADWEFVVFEVPNEINAFAMGGGKVGVFSGLFKIIENDDQLASVIAHEIAHVTAKHIHEQLSREMMVNAGGLVGGVALMGAGANVLTSQGLMNVYGLTAGVSGLAFSRKHELEADYIGLMYMARAGYNPEESPKVFDKLDEASASMPAQPAFLSTHPSNPERITALFDAMPKALKAREQSKVQNTPTIEK
jgi:predicted Zn-dependent protease